MKRLLTLAMVAVKACGYQFEDTVYWSARELVDVD
jgi:hypothetical protein